MSTFVITGASDGIGKATAHLLAKTRPDDRLILVGRNPDKTADVANQTDSEYFTADFADLSQVRALADKLNDATDRIDVLANNAGGIFDGPDITADGFEKTWQVNVVAPYLLTNLVLDPLRESRANVVATSSIGAFVFANFDPADPETRTTFSASRAYGNAKLGDAMMTAELARRVPDLSPVSFHPGVIGTSFASDTSWSGQRFYDLLRRTGGGGVDKGAKRMAYFMTGTAGVHFQRGRHYHCPGLRGPLARGMAHARDVFDDLDHRLGLTWPTIAP